MTAEVTICCFNLFVEARHDLKAYLMSLKEQFAGIDKLKTFTKEEKVNMFAKNLIHSTE